MSEVLPLGTQVAPVTVGLAFAVALVDGGRRILSDRLDLRLPGGEGILRLHLEDAELDGGDLWARARLENTSSVGLVGLRLDVIGGSETIRERASDGRERLDSTGPPVHESRPREFALPSPLHFGEVAAGDSSPALPLRVGPIVLADDTEIVVVLGVVTGFAEVATVSIPGVAGAVAIDVDARGRLFVADGPGRRILRLDADGSGVRELTGLDGEPLGLAVERRSGAFTVAVRGGTTVRPFSAAGKAGVPIPVVRPVGQLRLGRDGALVGLAVATEETPAALVRIHGKGAGDAVKLWDDGMPRATSFDGRLDGVTWVTTQAGALLRREPDGRTSLLDTAASAWLGDEHKGVACRVDAEDNVIVLNQGVAGSETVVSVVDAEGRFLRAWLAVPPVVSGWPVDLAVGPDGILLVVFAAPADGMAAVRVYRAI